jgi:hypothetical protein
MASTDSSDNSFDMELTDSSDPKSTQSLQNDVPSEVKLIIHNQSTSIELTSPAHAGLYATCYLLPDQNVDVGSTTQVSFGIDPDWWWWATGVLMYKLQGKNTDQSNEDVMSSEEETTCIQLVIVWKVNSSKEFSAASYLLEHSEECVWNKHWLLSLRKHYKLTNIQHSTIEDTWLVYDNTVLMTSLNMTHEEECYKLEITISEASISDDTLRPRYIGL